MHTASYKFLMKPKESAGCHQTLSSWVGSGDEIASYVACVCVCVCVSYVDLFELIIYSKFHYFMKLSGLVLFFMFL